MLRRLAPDEAYGSVDSSRCCNKCTCKLWKACEENYMFGKQLFFFYPITRGFNRECSFLTTGPIPENAFNVSGETGIRQLLQLDPTQVGCVRPCIATASGERVILRCCLRRKGMTTSEQLACYKLIVRFLGRRDNLARQNWLQGLDGTAISKRPALHGVAVFGDNQIAG